MMRLEYFFRNITLLNIALIAVIILLTSYLLFPLATSRILLNLPSGKLSTENRKEISSERSSLFPSDYAMIADENLFHPERKIPPEKKVEPPLLPKPDLVLYGTVLSDNLQIAYVEDLKSPISSPGRGRRQLILKKGDLLNGFILKEIEANGIIMVRGEETMTVNVHNTQRAKIRETSKTPVQAAPAPPMTPQQREVELKKLTKPPEPTTTTKAPRTRHDDKIFDIFNRQNR
jgi:hypothetical protein